MGRRRSETAGRERDGRARGYAEAPIAVAGPRCPRVRGSALPPPRRCVVARVRSLSRHDAWDLTSSAFALAPCDLLLDYQLHVSDRARRPVHEQGFDPIIFLVHMGDKGTSPNCFPGVLNCVDC